ncbi:hypothetical protein KTE19_11740 [Lentilactobacillus sp. IMAU92037]|nr:hypothetical protein [Lentilactobacillus dabitei]
MMTNPDTEKSTQQRPLSDATKEKLFRFQNILYIKYRPRRSWTQRIMGVLGHGKNNY